jgi:hypothetical protein
MFQHCPKCGHSPLPANQSLPAACPACGVILAKLAQVVDESDDSPSDIGLLPDIPTRMDPVSFWARVGLLLVFAVWGATLIGQDYRTGEMGTSFIHRPLLVFHEAGHVLFRLLGEWMMVLGGSLGQLIMPAILAGALLVKNRDPFGASIGLWFFGVSLLDVAPYVYDALHPQLMLLSGMTGEEGGHDWIFLLTSLGLLPKAQIIGAVVHKLGALVVILSLGWGAWVLRVQHQKSVP